MEPVKQKSKIVSVINFIVIFISICLIVGAFFAYEYLKKEGYFESLVIEESMNGPMTLEQKEQAVSTLESSSGIDVRAMNSTLNNMSEFDSEVSVVEVKRALDTLE